MRDCSEFSAVEETLVPIPHLAKGFHRVFDFFLADSSGVRRTGYCEQQNPGRSEMSKLQNQAKSIFDQALEIESDEERGKFLAMRFEESPDVREIVEGLLQAFGDAGSLLENPPVCVPETLARSGELISDQIGPFKILQKLGEGGMGSVFLAERQEPVKQRVALKLLKPGMDSRNFLARFEAERQALAVMDHPNIAKVIDAGCTERGHPFFVMELVKGVSICQYCDENRLSTKERLNLFLQVCDAVNHAHQKGIIHRDIKPSNVLVAQYDDKPVVKVIDFGVAKATNQRLTEKNAFHGNRCDYRNVGIHEPRASRAESIGCRHSG